MANSKADKLDEFIRRETKAALAEYALQVSDPEILKVLRGNYTYIAQSVAWGIARDAYRMKELQDIMDWKRPPKAD